MGYISPWHATFTGFLLESEYVLREIILRGVDAFIELEISLGEVFMSAKQSIEVYKCSVLEFLHRLIACIAMSTTFPSLTCSFCFGFQSQKYFC